MKRKEKTTPTKKGSKDNQASTCTKTKNGDSPKPKKKKVVLQCDKFCPKFGAVEIFCDKSTEEPYACTLNQTNIAQNNNKFFVIQVLKSFNANHYFAWIRWGRVGYHGQTALTDCGCDVEKAISIFEKKFFDKTKNNWDERHNFVKAPGKYDLVGTEFGSNDEDEDEVDLGIADAIKEEEDADSGKERSKNVGSEGVNGKSSTKNGSISSSKVSKENSSNIKKEIAECKLDLAVQELIRLICDVKAMEAAAADIEFDTKKTPLGKISAEQIKLGYATLSEIANILKDNANMFASKSRKVPVNNRRKLTDLSSEFYTRIPHCTGMRAPPVIDNDDLLEVKIQMLEVLGDIKLGMDLLRESSKANTENAEETKVRIHPIDRLYQNLRCDISSLSCESEEFSLLEQYIMSTHASTHSGYSMEVQEVICIFISSVRYF